MASSKRYHTDYHSRRHHRVKADTKAQKIIRAVLSFILFLFLFVLGLSICAKSVFVNPAFISKSFTSYDYTDKLCGDILQYAEDKCLESGISDKAAKSAITFEAVKKINDSYIASLLKASDSYSADSYQTYIGILKEDFSSLVAEQLTNSGIETDDSVLSGIEVLSNDLESYITERIAVKSIDSIIAAVNISSVLFLVLSVVFAVLSAVLALIIYYIGDKRYRSLRYISYSFGAAGIMNFICAAAVQLFKSANKFIIYPNYLLSAAMQHIKVCTVSLVFAGMAFSVAYVMLIAVVWKLKRKEK